MTLYSLRLAFDPGSGVCLWPVNDAARARYGYPVDHWQLPPSENTRRWPSHLVAWFDTSIDWASPADSDDRWDESELQRFLAAKQRGLELLAQELSPQAFEVRA